MRRAMLAKCKPCPAERTQAARDQPGGWAGAGTRGCSPRGERAAWLECAPAAEGIERLVRQLRRFRPDVVVTFAANGGYGHRDHMAIHQLTLAAVEAAAGGHPSGNRAMGTLPPHRVRKVYFGAFPREAMA